MDPGARAPPPPPLGPLRVPGVGTPGCPAHSQPAPCPGWVPGRTWASPSDRSGCPIPWPRVPGRNRGPVCLLGALPLYPPSSLISSLNYIRASPSSFVGLAKILEHKRGLCSSSSFRRSRPPLGEAPLGDQALLLEKILFGCKTSPSEKNLTLVLLSLD